MIIFTKFHEDSTKDVDFLFYDVSRFFLLGLYLGGNVIFFCKIDAMILAFENNAVYRASFYS